MIARLVMALLLALVSLPHAAPVAAAVPDCHAMIEIAPAEAPPAHPMPAEHACIGCIPPGDWLTSRVAAPALVAALPPHATVRRLDLGSGSPPALPPPRMT